MHSTFTPKNVENPGSFSDELNDHYRLICLPTLNLTSFIPTLISTLLSGFGSAPSPVLYRAAPQLHHTPVLRQLTPPPRSSGALDRTTPSTHYSVSAIDISPPRSGVVPMGITPPSHYGVRVYTTTLSGTTHVMTTDAGREVPDEAVRDETDVTMTEGGLESVMSLTDGTGNAGDTKETTVTPAMTDSLATFILGRKLYDDSCLRSA